MGNDASGLSAASREVTHMNSVDEKIIELSKTKIALTILGASAFVVIGGWLFSLDEASIRSNSRSFRLFLSNPTAVHAAGLLSIVIFGFCGLFAIKKLADKKPGLVFNSLGVIDNVSLTSPGLISWSEVERLEIFEVRNQKILVVKVRDPQKYIDHGSLWKRKLNTANYKMCGSPITISSNALKIDFSELLSEFNEYHRKYGTA